MADRQRGGQHVEHLGLGHGAAAEIGRDGVGQHVLVAQQLALQQAQVLLALVGAGQHVLQMRALLCGEYVGQARVEHRLDRGAVVHAASCLAAASSSASVMAAPPGRSAECSRLECTSG